MNELKTKLTELGLSDEMAQKAIEAVVGYAKTKLPESLHGTLDGVMSGETSLPEAGLGGMLDMAKGFFK